MRATLPPVATRTDEQTVNAALGEALGGLRRSWEVLADRRGPVLRGGGWPDVLVREPSGWPVAVEAKHHPNHAGAEASASARLGRQPASGPHPIETAIALVYPPEFAALDGAPLRAAIDATDALEYALCSRGDDGAPPDRLPTSGWLRGSVRDLAMLVQRAAVPARRVDALAETLERGVEEAAEASSERHGHGGDHGRALAAVLGQDDDAGGQTRRMAMTVVVNALVFHEALAQAGFRVAAEDGERPVRPVDAFRIGGGAFDRVPLLAEWDAILDRNYRPIFGSARSLLDPAREAALPEGTVQAVLRPLWRTALALMEGGVTRSHDLTGVVFQRLIADRKFLATYYTRPAAAALLAGLALPASRAPGGADWGDAETLASLQIGDFACGTGTLLSAAYSRLGLLHELHGGDPRDLHAPMMKQGLVGLDVLNIAVHLTAAMLAGAHPGTPFDGDCLLTMPWAAGEGGGEVSVGSLDLLSPHVQSRLIGRAAATTAGGRGPENVEDLATLIGHDRFDLVIMNPPFTRPTNHEASHANVPIPAYAAFDATAAEQEAMSAKVKSLTADAPSNDYAGLASHFAELAHRKVRGDGAVALVLPLSALSGGSWDGVRARWRDGYRDAVAVTIAGAGDGDSSFSADTGMAECLLVASRANGDATARAEPRAVFAVLARQPESAVRGELVAAAVRRAVDGGEVRRIEDGPIGGTPIMLGDEYCGELLDCPLPDDGPWPLAGVADLSLAQAAHRIGLGEFPSFASGPGPLPLPVARIGDYARPGPVHRSIGSPTAAARGVFRIRTPPITPAPTYPALWAHDNKRERALVVEPDSEGRVADASARGPERAARIWATATRAHYNAELRFNSQSLIVATTERPAIGGRAWPSVILDDRAHEYAFALWCNSTLGLLLHWWTANKTQAGRGATTVTAIPRIPALDVRALSPAQHEAAREAFEALRGERFLPFDQIDEDPARAELDRRLLLNVLGLPPALCEDGGPLALLRRKLAAEPQIHGGKRTRVVFEGGGERAERRPPR